MKRILIFLALFCLILSAAAYKFSPTDFKIDISTTPEKPQPNDVVDFAIRIQCLETAKLLNGETILMVVFWDDEQVHYRECVLLLLFDKV
jgi:hypothetical protein